MKKIFYFALLALAPFAFNACNPHEPDVVIEGPDTDIPDTYAKALALVNQIPRQIQTLSSSYSFLVESATDNTVCFEEKDESKDGPQVSYFETEKSNWYPIKVFNRLYTSINDANKAFSLISQADTAKISGAVKPATLLARAKFWRGYNHFQLVQLFGEVPYITSRTPSDAERTTRKSIDEVYSLIVQDLEEAIPNLPQTATDKAVPTQLAAKTILAKLYLTWGQKPLTQSEVAAIASATTDPTKPAPDNARLQKAIDYADEVINSNKYSLRADYNRIWGVDNENNSEVIFDIKHEGDGIDAQGNHQTHCGYTWPKNERTDPHIQWADISFEWGPTETVDGVEGNGLDASDLRRHYSFATRLEFFDGNIDTLTWPLSIVRPGKWIHRDGTGSDLAKDAQPNNIDHIDFRLAEVYLIKAEAQFYSNAGDKGLAAVNALRSRAGVTPLAGISEESLQREWFNELAFEQKHWLNLVRWRTLISTVKTKVPQFEYYKEVYNNKTAFDAYSFNGISSDPNRFAFYQRIYKHLRGKVSKVNGHFYRFPIPLSEKYTDLGITPQNPGY